MSVAGFRGRAGMACFPSPSRSLRVGLDDRQDRQAQRGRGHHAVEHDLLDRGPGELAVKAVDCNMRRFVSCGYSASASATARLSSSVPHATTILRQRRSGSSQAPTPSFRPSPLCSSMPHCLRCGALPRRRPGRRRRPMRRTSLDTRARWLGQSGHTRPSPRQTHATVITVTGAITFDRGARARPGSRGCRRPLPAAPHGG